MLAGVTSTSTHPGPYIGGGGGGGVGQSPDIRGSLRQHLSAEASSLTSKVHTVILTGLKLRRQHWCFLGCLLVIVLLLLVIWMASGSSISGSSDLKSMSEAKRA